MKKLEFTKDLEGKTIYLKGTGNNARGNLANKVLEAVVVKVARVNVTIKIEDHFYERKLRKSSNSENSNRLEGECNGGYKCYYSLEDIEEERKAQENYDKIKEIAFNTWSSRKLTLKQTEAILKILEGGEDEC